MKLIEQENLVRTSISIDPGSSSLTDILETFFDVDNVFRVKVGRPVEWEGSVGEIPGRRPVDQVYEATKEYFTQSYRDLVLREVESRWDPSTTDSVPIQESVEVLLSYAHLREEVGPSYELSEN